MLTYSEEFLSLHSIPEGKFKARYFVKLEPPKGDESVLLNTLDYQKAVGFIDGYRRALKDHNWSEDA